MGAYIPGIDRPEKPELCKFYQEAPFRAPYCAISTVCKGLDECPLVPVPKHGRLIDADALCEGRVSNDNVVICAKCAPTIIPASGGKENE